MRTNPPPEPERREVIRLFLRRAHRLLCGHCHRPLKLRSPERERPERLLACCACGRWWVAMVTDEEEGLGVIGPVPAALFAPTDAAWRRLRKAERPTTN
jgi:hypothetical protein